MRNMLVALLVVAVPASAWAQGDEKKTCTALWGEGSRFEGEKEFAKGIEKYKKALDKAVADKRNDVAAKCLVGIGRCSEQLVPENVSDALAAYGRIVSEFSDQKEQADWAAEKLKKNGVDTYVRIFAAAVSGWRDVSRERATALEEKKKETWAKIQPLDVKAQYGLASCLNYKDQNVTLFVAWMLAEVTDADGIAQIAKRFGEKEYVGGAALAMNKVFEKWNTAHTYDVSAGQIKIELEKVDLKPLDPIPSWVKDCEASKRRMQEKSQKSPGDKYKDPGQNQEYPLTAEDIAGAKAGVARLDDLLKQWGELGKVRDAGIDKNRKNLERAAALEATAAGIRHNIPKELNADGIQAAFAAIIADENADQLGRIEACKCLASVGDIGGALVEAVLKALSSKDRNVRKAACDASGAVDTSKSDDKHKLVNRLLEIIEDVEEGDVSQKDPANDPLAREAACQAVGQIAVIKSVPSLIKALSDNSAAVRFRANEALQMIAGKDVGYESEPLISDPKRELSEQQKREKQLEIRKQGIAKWQQWWDETGGIVVLVERFYKYAAGWKSFAPAKLFNEEAFLVEIRSRAYTYEKAEEAVDAEARAKRECQAFQKVKNFHVQDAVDVGQPALDKLMKYLSGVIDWDPKKYAAAPTRLFVAEAIAKIAEKSGGSAVADKLGDMVGAGASPEEKAGAASALGFLPKNLVSGGARASLESRGLTSEPVVKEASADALSRVGDEVSSGKALATVGTTLTEKADVAIAALRALAALKPRDTDIVRMLCGLIADEPEPPATPKKRAGDDPKDDLVREWACVALGEIGDPTAIKELGLIRARRDTSLNVRIAARKALDQVVSKNADSVKDMVATLKDAKSKADDRRGAALALGVAGTGAAQSLVTTLIDENPPLKLRDTDSAVRAAVAHAMGEMGAKAKVKAVGEALLTALESDIAEEVRREAYLAMLAIGGSAVPEYNPVDPQDLRTAALEKIRNWFKDQNWPAAQ